MNNAETSSFGEFVECPYNQVHHILKSRIQTHLIKCRKNYPKAKKATCPFNSTHVINAPEIKYHIEICPDKAMVAGFRYLLNTTPNGEASSSLPAPPILHDEIPCAEDWSEDNHRTYDPQKYTSTANVILNKIGAQPAEKIAFRRAERERLKKLENGN